MEVAEDIARRLFDDGTGVHAISNIDAEKLKVQIAHPVVENVASNLLDKENSDPSSLVPDLHLLKATALDTSRDVSRELERSKEQLSRLKFSFKELSSKQVFLREVASDRCDMNANIQEQEDRLEEEREQLKKSKENVKRLTRDCVDTAAKACQSYDSLLADINRLQHLRNSPYEPDQKEQEEMQALVQEIDSLQEKLREQETSIRELAEKKEEAEAKLHSARAENEKTASRSNSNNNNNNNGAAASSVVVGGAASTLTTCEEWYQNANALMEGLSKKKIVAVRAEGEVEVALAAVAGGEEGGEVTLTLHFDPVTGVLQHALCTADVNIDDIVEECVRTNDAQTLVREVEFRCQNSRNTDTELEKLRQQNFVVEENWMSTTPPSRCVFVKEMDSSWELVIALATEYPQDFAPCHVSQLKHDEYDVVGGVLEQGESAGFKTVTEWALLCRQKIVPSE